MNEDKEPDTRLRRASKFERRVLFIIFGVVAAGIFLMVALAVVLYFTKDMRRDLFDGKPESLNMQSLRSEIQDNRPGALNRYLGKRIVVTVKFVEIQGGTADGINLWMRDDSAKSGIWYLAAFRFGDHPWMAKLKAGECKPPFKLTGKIAAITKRHNYTKGLDEFEEIELSECEIDSPAR